MSTIVKTLSEVRVARPARIASALAATAALWLSQDAEAACPTTEAPVSCVRYSDRLVVESSAGRLVLKGTWSKRDELNRFTTHDPFTIAVSDAIQFPVPGVADVTVTCSPYLAIEGTVTSLPDLGVYWPGTSVETSQPSIHMGLALGEQISDLDVPVEACRSYFYFALQTSASYSFGGAEAGIIDGNDIKLVLDPMDPGFVFEVGGPTLGELTGGFVNRAGFGVSRNGTLAWESALDLPTGFGADAGEEVVDLSGHVWATGKFGLIPIPNLPVQLTFDGDAVVNLGTFAKTADETLGALLSGDTADLQSIIEAQYVGFTPAQILNRIAIGANMNALSLSMEFFSLDLARGSLALDDGKLRFAAEAWTPGEGLAPGGAGMPLLDAALAAITVKMRGSASGYVDANGYHFELGGNFMVGPLTINNAKLVIDSENGVTVERGDLKFDPVAFAEQMKTIFHCDFGAGLANCKVGGFKVLSANASIQNGNVKMGVKLDIFGLSSAEFNIVKAANGEFRFVLNLDRVPSVFTFSLLSAKLVVSRAGVRMDAKMDRIISNETFSGFLWKTQGQVRWNLGFTGTTNFFMMPQVAVSASFSNATGPVKVTFKATVKPAQINPALTGSNVVLSGEFATDGKYSLSGQGALVVAGYPLANLAISLSNLTGTHVFTLAGNFDAKAIHVKLGGSFDSGSSAFVLNGTSDFTVQGYNIVAGAFTLSTTSGLAVTGRLNLGVMSFDARGSVSPAGNVDLTASASVAIPVDATVKEVVRAAYCVQKTIQAAGQCAGEYVTTTISEFSEHFSCGMEPVWSCTEAVVRQVSEYVQDAALCGVETVGCGLQQVADGAKCGFDIVAEKIPAGIACGFELLHCSIWHELNGQYCDPVWAPPASCMIAAQPRTCTVDFGVCQAKTCEKITTWTDPAQCTQVGEQMAACWHDVTITTPKVCNEIVSQECYPEESTTTNTTLGYFNGTVSVTFGTTLGANLSGSYCDLSGSCRSWGIGGSVDLLQSGAQICVDIPAEVFPAGAIFGLSSPTGTPRFCL